MPRQAFTQITEAQLLPRVVHLGGNLYGAAFTLMKMVPARHIMMSAEERGEIGPGTTVAETTSGTFGLALAMQCALMRRRFVMVSDPVIDANLRRRLLDLGTEIVICAQPAAVGGYQRARLDALEAILAAGPDTFCPQQYSNPDNPRSYSIVADHLTETLGSVDCLVGPVGSGGSMCGTATSLRVTQGAQVTAIGVDTHRSVLFGGTDGSRELRGLGNSLLPANLDHRVFDEIHWCSAGEAYAATRSLHRRHALFQGPTSGAAYRVARWWADLHPDQRCVVMLPDEGYRYVDTVYDDDWTAGRRHRAPSTTPREIAHPSRLGESWSRFAWNRRTHDAVVAATPPRQEQDLAS